jgi:hypothetical protein
MHVWTTEQQPISKVWEKQTQPYRKEKTRPKTKTADMFRDSRAKCIVLNHIIHTPFTSSGQ